MAPETLNQNDILDQITPDDTEADEPTDTGAGGEPEPKNDPEPKPEVDEFKGAKHVPYDRFKKVNEERTKYKEQLAKYPKDFDPEKWQKDQERYSNIEQREQFLQKIADTIESHPWLDNVLTRFVKGEKVSRAELIQAVAAIKEEEGTQQPQGQVQPQTDLEKRLAAIENQFNTQREEADFGNRVNHFKTEEKKLLSNPKFKEALGDESFLNEVWDRAEVVQARLGDKDFVNLEKVAETVLVHRTQLRERWFEEQRKAGTIKAGAGIPKASGPAGGTKKKPAKQADPGNYNAILDELEEAAMGEGGDN